MVMSGRECPNLSWAALMGTCASPRSVACQCRSKRHVTWGRPEVVGEVRRSQILRQVISSNGLQPGSLLRLHNNDERPDRNSSSRQENSNSGNFLVLAAASVRRMHLAGFLCFQGEDALLACLHPSREFRHHDPLRRTQPSEFGGFGLLTRRIQVRGGSTTAFDRLRGRSTSIPCSIAMK